MTYVVSMTTCDDWSPELLLSKLAHPTSWGDCSGSLVQSEMVPWGTGFTSVAFVTSGDQLPPEWEMYKHQVYKNK